LEKVVPRFLPYTLVNAPEYPILLLKLYLSLGYSRFLVANKCKIGGRIEEKGRAFRMEMVGRPWAFFV